MYDSPVARYLMVLVVLVVVVVVAVLDVKNGNT